MREGLLDTATSLLSSDDASYSELLLVCRSETMLRYSPMDWEELHQCPVPTRVTVPSLFRRLDGMIGWANMLEVAPVGRPKRRRVLLVTMAQRRNRLDSNNHCLRQTSRRCQWITISIHRAGKLTTSAASHEPLVKQFETTQSVNFIGNDVTVPVRQACISGGHLGLTRSSSKLSAPQLGSFVGIIRRLLLLVPVLWNRCCAIIVSR